MLFTETAVASDPIIKEGAHWPQNLRNGEEINFSEQRECCGVNHKHPSGESGIWNLAFKSPQKNLNI